MGMKRRQWLYALALVGAGCMPAFAQAPADAQGQLDYTEAELARERAAAAELMREIETLRTELAALRAAEAKPVLRAVPRKRPRPHARPALNAT